MKIIKDNTQSKIETCEKCGSILECSPADYIIKNEYTANLYHFIDMEYFVCPCCGHCNYLKYNLDGINFLAKNEQIKNKN